MQRLAAIALAIMLPTLVLPAGPVRAEGEVTIYRCTDAKGKLSLRDSPCAKGERQETRSMLRPKDAPPRTVVDKPVATVAAPQAPAQVIVAYNPRPLYECTRPDGTSYTSDTDEGAPRWVPLWTLGYPVGPRSLALGDRIGAPTPSPPSNRPGPPMQGNGLVYGAGTWVRDSCYPLPPSEVCARLRDRRDEIRRRFFNAQPSERATLNLEERGINARLDNDCGRR